MLVEKHLGGERTMVMSEVNTPSIKPRGNSPKGGSDIHATECAGLLCWGLWLRYFLFFSSFIHFSLTFFTFSFFRNGLSDAIGFKKLVEGTCNPIVYSLTNSLYDFDINYLEPRTLSARSLSALPHVPDDLVTKLFTLANAHCCCVAPGLCPPFHAAIPLL